MEKIEISEDVLSSIINKYCSCGGRGPNDNPCDACAIYHEITQASQSRIQADAGCPKMNSCYDYYVAGDGSCQFCEHRTA